MATFTKMWMLKSDHVRRQQRGKIVAAIIGVTFLGILSLGKAGTPIETNAVAVQPAEKIATAPALADGNFIVTKQNVLGCAILNDTAVRTGKATGRIYDLSDPDRCRGIKYGTSVRLEKYSLQAACVVPQGATGCLWVLWTEIR